MIIEVQLYSYFRDLAGAHQLNIPVDPGTTLDGLVEKILEQKPALKPLRRSMLMAVGVDYQKGDYLLQPGDQVSLFPPVQGG